MDDEIRVLVVDDSAAVIDAMVGILTTEGYQVEWRNDGESGWKRLVEGVERKAPMPDLLLLDLNMPGIDGLTLLKRLRADERFGLLPVIILTVEADWNTRLEALKSGANDYLPKPIETVDLMVRVESLLGLKLAERRQQRRMEHLVEAGRTLLSTRDLQNVLERVMQIVVTEMEAEGASVWLPTATGGLRCQAAYGAGSERLLNLSLQPGQGIAGWSLQHRQSALVPNAPADLRFYAGVDQKVGFHTHGLIAVPLLVRENSIGVLEVVNKKHATFSVTDLAWMEVLAPLAAAAIANAQLFQTLHHRTAELQARNQDLDAFAHTVAHDLKSPLARIVGFSETLERDWTEVSQEELGRYLRIIAQNGRKMSRIIDELLLLAGVRQMEVELRPLDMKSIVNDALNRLADMIQAQQAEITFPDAWPVALGYAPWVEEVWVNYISNAIKYGGQPPRVTLGAAAHPGSAAPAVRFYVRDNGAGITPEAQARLFTPFTRLEQVHVEGHGLGLSIVRRIVEKLNGQVSVESQMGQGSVFSFTLPSAEGERRGGLSRAGKMTS